MGRARSVGQSLNQEELLAERCSPPPGEPQCSDRGPPRHSAATPSLSGTRGGSRRTGTAARQGPRRQSSVPSCAASWPGGLPPAPGVASPTRAAGKRGDSRRTGRAQSRARRCSASSGHPPPPPRRAWGCWAPARGGRGRRPACTTGGSRRTCTPPDPRRRRCRRRPRPATAAPARAGPAPAPRWRARAGTRGGSPRTCTPRRPPRPRSVALLPSARALPRRERGLVCGVAGPARPTPCRAGGRHGGSRHTRTHRRRRGRTRCGSPAVAPPRILGFAQDHPKMPQDGAPPRTGSRQREGRERVQPPPPSMWRARRCSRNGKPQWTRR